jgi:hypothetical protein
MPTEQELEDFCESIKGLTDSAQRWEMLSNRWPENENRKIYYTWAWGRNRPKTPPPHPSLMPAEELLDLITKTDFNNESARNNLADVIQSLQTRAYMPLGTINGEIYRISRENGCTSCRLRQTVLTPDLLEVNIPPSTPTESFKAAMQMLSTKITGAYFPQELVDKIVKSLIEVHPRLQARRSTCFQLRRVEEFEGDDISDPADDDSWYTIGFAAVIKIAPSCSIVFRLSEKFMDSRSNSWIPC